MDLLYRRYADPFSFADHMIAGGRFGSFVEFLLKKEAEEKNNAMMWDFFLHKVYDKSFAEFRKEMTDGTSSGDVMGEAEKKAIMARSEGILNGFKPGG